MDINLLDDTKQDEAKKKSAAPAPEPELTSPSRLPKASEEPKTASRFSSWLKSLRGAESVPGAKKPRLETANPDLNIPDISLPKTAPAPAAEDIFEQLDAPKKKLETIPPTNFSPQPKERAEAVVVPEKPVAQAKPAVVPPLPEPAPKAKVEKKRFSLAPKKEKKEEVDRGSLVNLIPTEFRQTIDPRSKLMSLGITLISCLVILAASFAFLTYYRTSILEKIQKLRSDRSVVETDISELRPRQREAVEMNRRLTIAADLLDQHIYWTKFFEKLEKYTIDDVYYTGAMTGSLEGQMTLTAVGSSFASPARQLLVLQQASDFVTDVTITSASSAQSSSASLPPGSVAEAEVSFSVTITLVPDIFSYTADTFPPDRQDTTEIPGTPSLDPLNPFGLPSGTNTNTSVGNTNVNGSL